MTSLTKTLFWAVLMFTQGIGIAWAGDNEMLMDPTDSPAILQATLTHFEVDPRLQQFAGRIQGGEVVVDQYKNQIDLVLKLKANCTSEFCFQKFPGVFEVTAPIDRVRDFCGARIYRGEQEADGQIRRIEVRANGSTNCQGFATAPNTEVTLTVDAKLGEDLSTDRAVSSFDGTPLSQAKIGIAERN